MRSNACRRESSPSSAARSRDRSTRSLAVRSFVEFQQHFGGLWQPSTLSYAVEQFFENGGREARIVRVVNGARPPTLTLPAGAGVLRADRDSIPARASTCAPRSTTTAWVPASTSASTWSCSACARPGSELVEDQEIYRRVSITPSAVRYVRDVLLESRLVRVSGAAARAAPGPHRRRPWRRRRRLRALQSRRRRRRAADRLRHHRLGRRAHRAVRARRARRASTCCASRR